MTEANVETGGTTSTAGTVAAGDAAPAGLANVVGSPTPAPTPPPAPTTAPTPAPEPLDYFPELSETCIYRDEHGHLSAAIITRVIDAETEEVGLVVFPDESHHRHVRALPVERSHDVVKDAPGWYPNGA